MNKSTALLAGLLTAGALVLAPAAASAAPAGDHDFNSRECRDARNDLDVALRAVVQLPSNVFPAGVPVVGNIDERLLQRVLRDDDLTGAGRVVVQSALRAFDRRDRECRRPTPTVTVTPTVTPTVTTTVVPPPTVIVQRPRGGVDTGA